MPREPGWALHAAMDQIEIEQSHAVTVRLGSRKGRMIDHPARFSKLFDALT